MPTPNPCSRDDQPIANENTNPSRRLFLAGLPAIGITGLTWPTVSRAAESESATAAAPWPDFPYVDADLVRGIVGASHFNEARVRELVEQKPELVNATWDWGFGDFETALGAASHTGRRSIAEFLLENGARLDIFAAAMLGMTDVVKGMVRSIPGIQRTLGPHGITLLDHARAGGDKATDTFAYLESLGDADQPTPSQELAESEYEHYFGEYAFGSGAQEYFEVKKNRRGDLHIAVGDGVSRRMNFLGNHEFFPAGAPSVRIRFELENNKAVKLTLVDQQGTLKARRS